MTLSSMMGKQSGIKGNVNEVVNEVNSQEFRMICASDKSAVINSCLKHFGTAEDYTSNVNISMMINHFVVPSKRDIISSAIRASPQPNAHNHKKKTKQAEEKM